MPARYYSAVPIQGEQVVLDGDEAHHLLHVMRAKKGDMVTLFDDSGCEFEAKVSLCQRRTVNLTIHERSEVDRELDRRVVMGVALPKGDRQKWLVEKLTELGVAVLIPLQTERGVALPGAAAVERLQRTVIEASKQCGRTRLMSVAPPQQFAVFIDSADKSATQILAHPTGPPFDELRIGAEQAVVCAIGPEGGLTEREIGMALAKDWKTVSLGARILRIETAAIALAARLS